MVQWITNWAQGIIVAVIIATIIEMLLPEGNCKKYIKVVIGVYILFSIISPVITKITGKNFNISEELNLDKFYEEADSQEIYNSLNSNNSSSIKDIYIGNLKTDIKSKLKNKNYNVLSCDIEIENEETYEVKKLKLKIEKIAENEDEDSSNNNDSETETSNTVSINAIQSVNILVSDSTNNNTTNNNNASSNTNSNLTTKDKKEIKEYLQETYEIKKENIYID